MRLIDADEFIATHGMPLTMSQFYGNTAELKSFNEGIRFVVECMKGFPVHDPAALEKQIPTKPLPDVNFGFKGICPNCRARFIDDTTKYCGNCGQALDWSVSE